MKKVLQFVALFVLSTITAFPYAFYFAFEIESYQHNLLVKRVAESGSMYVGGVRLFPTAWFIVLLALITLVLFLILIFSRRNKNHIIRYVIIALLALIGYFILFLKLAPLFFH